jgi:hypothetical protein
MPSPSNRRRRLFHEKRFRLSMIFSDNRFTLFRIMLFFYLNFAVAGGDQERAAKSGRSFLGHL